MNEQEGVSTLAAIGGVRLYDRLSGYYPEGLTDGEIAAIASGDTAAESSALARLRAEKNAQINAELSSKD